MTDNARPHQPIDMNRHASLREFLAARGVSPEVEYVETTPVTDGVTCDVYRFRDSEAYDLAIVEVRAGKRTPLQRVLTGTETIEGHLAGRGTLTVRAPNGRETAYRFPAERATPVAVAVGEIMQWHADSGETLMFFELCAPPYTDGRFEDLGVSAGGTG
ncbi:hypothetical protein CA850_23115 [Micromonospora echinospora]|uniref:Uncharacterized protein n=1 Tax=Micromonospora echinospora TaxID=1877 RepID=A0A1C4YSP7_MICEC|nr:hypothetical protein [Micromonospora echinospora]OZV77350.1 hypothetical protein CA850_23115 [Micromonospora echinospora]SCF23361.1 hypothetical protein GA0070618_4286 [Micromonospora echinospora]